MRAALLALMAFGTLSAIDCTPAEARPSGYPICMHTLYGDDDCSFTSLQQCGWSASGLGQTCFRNPATAYGRVDGNEPAPRRRVRQRRDY